MNNEDLFTEDELFDDRYGYSGHELSVSFTHYLPGYIKLEMVGNRLWKFYQNRQVYDLEGILSEIDDTRTDNRVIIWGSLSCSFAMNWGVKSLSVSVQGGYLKNNSNDSYYQFDNCFGSLGLEFKLK